MGKNITFVTRSDDAGSSMAANAAILQVITKGNFIKNVSVMAPCKYVDEAAMIFKGRKEVLFGMHATLNAEWDGVKWRPVTDIKPSAGLTDESGYFIKDPRIFEETKPDIGIIMKEFNAQLDKLARAGFSISYFDTHMMPEMYIPGLDDELKSWAEKKGLIDHMYYYDIPQSLLDDSKGMFKKLKDITDGQYFFVTHPALYGEEMLKAGNENESAEKVARSRSKEAKMFSSKLVRPIVRMFGITPLKYDEAKPLERRTPQELKEFLNGEEK